MGTVVLVIGLGSALWIWVAQDRLERQKAGQAGEATGQLPDLDSRKDVRELQMYYGQSGVLMEEATEWLESLAHGKRLAATVAVASLVVGIGCFLAAAYLLPALERGRQPPENVSR